MDRLGDPAGGPLVHLEADPTAFEPGDYTFYGRFVAFDGSDGREPLATTWAARYLAGGVWADATSVVVWRGPKRAGDPPPRTCGTGPPVPLPLAADRVIGFDEEENPEQPGVATAAFPLAVQKVAVGQAELPVTAPFGWLYLDLNHAGPPGPAGTIAQSWVAVAIETATGLGLGYDALPFDNALLPNPPLPEGIFEDGFESGDVSAWTGAAPLAARRR